MHSISSEIRNLENRILKREREWQAEENRFFNKINPFKSDDLKRMQYEKENEKDRNALKTLHDEENNLPQQRKEIVADMQNKEFQLRKAHYDDVYGFDMENFAKAQEQLKNGEIPGSFVPFLENLEGITKINGDVDFGETKLKNLGDVKEITGSLILKHSYINDIGNLQTVKGSVVSNEDISIDKWAEVDIGEKLYQDSKNISKEYYHLRGQDREYEQKIKREQDDLYHSRGIER